MNPDPLAQLRGYHLPEPIGWWPPAIGWWLVAALAVLVCLALAVWLLHRRRRHAARRAARRELRRLQTAHAADGDDLALVRGLSRLLRRYALVRYPRETVAGLSGAEWLGFLDSRIGGDRFCHGPGRVLIDAPYRPTAQVPATELVALVDDWLKRAAAGDLAHDLSGESARS